MHVQFRCYPFTIGTRTSRFQQSKLQHVFSEVFTSDATIPIIEYSEFILCVGGGGQ